MKLDCYAVLGLSPAAEDAVIRAAYLALMRSYHPDKNPSPEAAARVRSITEAYKTIGDPARRAAYDAARSEHIFEILGYDEEAEPRAPKGPRVPALRWPGAPVAGVAGAALAVLLAIVALPQMRSERPGPPRPAPSKEVAATPSPVAEKDAPPRRAIAIPAPLAERAPPPVAAEAAKPERPSAPTPEPAPAIAAKAPVKAPPAPKRLARASSAPPAARAAAPKPSPVDEKARVATLEGMSTSFYNQSVNLADGAKRSRLQQARDLFVSARNACRTDKCVGDAHASHIRDISEIMRSPKPANP